MGEKGPGGAGQRASIPFWSLSSRIPHLHAFTFSGHSCLFLHVLSCVSPEKVFQHSPASFFFSLPSPASHFIQDIPDSNHRVAGLCLYSSHYRKTEVVCIYFHFKSCLSMGPFFFLSSRGTAVSSGHNYGLGLLPNPFLLNQSAHNISSLP